MRKGLEGTEVYTGKNARLFGRKGRESCKACLG
jgi:hypothetical protein